MTNLETITLKATMKVIIPVPQMLLKKLNKKIQLIMIMKGIPKYRRYFFNYFKKVL